MKITRRATEFSRPLSTPILISEMNPESLRSALPIVRNGRFMLNVNCKEGDDPKEIVKSIRRAGILGG